MKTRTFIQLQKNFYVDAEFKKAFEQLGLTNIDSVFAFNAGRNLAKNDLAKHRTRMQFQTQSPAATMYLKRYDNPPRPTQLKNWFAHRRIATTMFYDLDAAEKLHLQGINTPRTIAYGSQAGPLFEKRSFIITEKVPGQSLERRLPACFQNKSLANLKAQRKFIAELAGFAARFHNTGFRHRDFYFAHIFYDDNDFYLIDLARAFKPLFFSKRYRIKDIAQLCYGASAKYFSKTDRLRFYHAYTGRARLTHTEKSFIRAVINKISRMARHDRKHNRAVPFEL